MTSNYKKIGDYIRLVDVRNRDLEVKTLLGLSISKEFIPSVANTVGTDMANYKIIKKGQFACSLMQVRRDKKIPVALQIDFDEAIISQAYSVFEVVNTESLDPEYLMMWMSRSEFDRHACFLAVGGVRGSLEWDDFCDMELPVPSIEEQREIVREYNVVNDRIALNEQLTQKLQDTAQAIYKQWFVDFEFPISKECAESIGKPELEGKPYKSSGGETLYSDKFQKEIPVQWRIGNFTDICEITMGQSPKGDTYNTEGVGTALVNGPVEFGSYFTTKSKWTTSPTKLCKSKDLIVCVRGSTTGRFVVSDDTYCLGRGVCSFSAFKFQEYVNLAYKNSLQELLTLTTGSTFPSWSRDDLNSINVLLPCDGSLAAFENLALKLSQRVQQAQKENEQLISLSQLLMVKLSKV
ncbi:restriction endonuclease subunit S [Vibrio metschnikovii]|uniref:restriction endonuclease subunit S n=1 Tax=Vibrio metschnikovii TaxID=28172 RepID=UPI002FC59B90|nr:restriction endonuclease subunit S [Vibrio metschnikovii]EKO3756565.1 restriction endonuclease subunit S [Vibrio metschnikovii]